MERDFRKQVNTLLLDTLKQTLTAKKPLSWTLQLYLLIHMGQLQRAHMNEHCTILCVTIEDQYNDDTTVSTIHNGKVCYQMGLLLDTNKLTILEVFGMSKNVTSYHMRREAKVSHFNSLEKYNFWFWNAFKSPNNMPNIPIKNEE